MDHSIQIGHVRIEHPFLLAPMAHYTNRPARVMARRFGASMVYTEMIAAQHFVRCGPRYRVIADFGEDERPIAAQMAPATVEYAVRATELFNERGFDLIEINMACPAPKIVKRGRGGALLRDPDRAVAILESVVANTSRPVTAKLRCGWDTESGPCATDLAVRLVDAGASAISLHPRYVKQLYKGPSNWLFLTELVEAVDVPVIGSGDLKTASDALNMLAETRCAAVAFARGAVGNPWIFRQALAKLDGREPPPAPSAEEAFAVICEHCRLSAEIAVWPDEYHILRRTLPRYLKGIEGRAGMLRDLNTTRTQDDWNAWKRKWGFEQA